MPLVDDALEQDLRDTLGAAVAPAPWPEASRLPPFLSDRYYFLQASLFDFRAFADRYVLIGGLTATSIESVLTTLRTIYELGPEV